MFVVLDMLFLLESVWTAWPLVSVQVSDSTPVTDVVLSVRMA